MVKSRVERGDGCGIVDMPIACPGGAGGARGSEMLEIQGANKKLHLSLPCGNGLGRVGTGPREGLGETNQRGDWSCGIPTSATRKKVQGERDGARGSEMLEIQGANKKLPFCPFGVETALGGSALALVKDLGKRINAATGVVGFQHQPLQKRSRGSGDGARGSEMLVIQGANKKLPFCPFRVETVLGGSVLALVKDFGNESMRRLEIQDRRRFWAQKISIAVQRGNAASILASADE
ncbi:hypothetical protein ACOME3_005642 [Neoechinorhynchus agilis]